nr:UPF0236 family protein [Caldibacillus debilis]
MRRTDSFVKREEEKRFRLLDKRKLRIVILFGEIEIKRNCYRDRKTGEYVDLLDRFFNFERTLRSALDGGGGGEIAGLER